MGSGSTILARQSNEIYIPIFIALGIAVIVFIVFWILKQVKAYKESPKYIEKQKNRITNSSDIKIFKEKYNLTNEDAALLWNICENCSPKNINYLIHDNIGFDALFKEAYKKFREHKAEEKTIFDFFQLRYKIEQTLAQAKKLSSTENLPVGSMILYIDNNGEQFPLTLHKNEQSFMTLAMPDSFEKNKPKELSKSDFIYRTTDGLNYLYSARPIRYTNTGGQHYMVTSHSTNLSLGTQRQTKREVVKADCTFAPVKAEKDKDSYVHSKKRYPAKIMNISAGGCCIQTQLPIKERQLITIFYPELGMDETTIGIIRRSRTISGGELHALHIQFIKTTLEVQNKIYAFVYKY